MKEVPPIENNLAGIKYLKQSVEYATAIHGDILRETTYGGSTFIVFKDMTVYRLNFEAYKNKVVLDSQPVPPIEVKTDNMITDEEIKMAEKKYPFDKDHGELCQCSWCSVSADKRKSYIEGYKAAIRDKLSPIGAESEDEIWYEVVKALMVNPSLWRSKKLEEFKQSFSIKRKR